jgi:hypothetical protein
MQLEEGGRSAAGPRANRTTGGCKTMVGGGNAVTAHTENVFETSERTTSGAEGPPVDHDHELVRLNVLRLESGIPYEVEQAVCRQCAETVTTRRVRRAVA